MAKNNGKSGKQMRDEARTYGRNTPAENAAGRMANEDGSPSDEAGWQGREHGQQQSTLKTKPKAPPVSSANKDKKGNQPRI